MTTCYQHKRITCEVKVLWGLERKEHQMGSPKMQGPNRDFKTIDTIVIPSKLKEREKKVLKSKVKEGFIVLKVDWYIDSKLVTRIK